MAARTLAPLLDFVERPMSTIYVSHKSSANWYDGAIAAYQPKGAASLAASYTNLANPGTYDAAPGIAPTWDATNGWTFDGITTYLTTGIIPLSNYTMIVRFSNWSSGTAIGVQTPSTARFWLRPDGFWGYGNAFEAGNVQVAGTRGMAANTGYVDGVSIGTVGGTWVASTSDIYLGASNVAPVVYGSGNIQAAGIWATALTAGKIAAKHTLMAAL